MLYLINSKGNPVPDLINSQILPDPPLGQPCEEIQNKINEIKDSILNGNKKNEIVILNLQQHYYLVIDLDTGLANRHAIEQK